VLENTASAQEIFGRLFDLIGQPCATGRGSQFVA